MANTWPAEAVPVAIVKTVCVGKAASDVASCQVCPASALV